MKHDDIEALLGGLKPRGAGAELRPRVLAAVEQELAAQGGWHVPELAKGVPSTGKHALRDPQAGAPAQGVPPTTVRHVSRRAAIAVAAALVMGIAVNVAVDWRAEQRMAQLVGPAPVPRQIRELARDVEQVADAQTAKWVVQQFSRRPPPANEPAAYLAYAELLRRISDDTFINVRDTHETPKKAPEMDRDHLRGIDRDRSDWQRDLRLDHRYTA
jgi:hypothetical protein